MTESTAAPSTSKQFSVAVQKFGTFLSGMIMPNIPALIAWGILTAFVIPVGWTPNESLAEMVGPTIHYLLPLLIANTAGRMVYDARGGVVASVATMGVIVGSDHLVAVFNESLQAGQDPLSEVHMFIGAMIMGPLAAWVMKQLDRLWEGKIKAGFEMLVNLFSAGIAAFGLAVFGFYVVARIVNTIMEVLGGAVEWLITNHLLPLTSLVIEPAKVFFLNNAINHGVLTPLGTQMSSEHGKSILYLLEANPGPGLGILLAFTIFGVGAARASAPGAAIIHFLGGIHEIYFPYVLMKPALLLAVIAGGATGVTTNMLLDAGLRAPAAPGSVIAIIAQTASDSYLGVILSVVLSATVSFLIAAVILRASRKRDLESDNDAALEAAIAKTEANKGKKSDALAGLSAGTAIRDRDIRNVVFACDAGMGSSAMGASVMRTKVKKAGISGISVTNKSIANLDGSEDLIITQQELTGRAKQRVPNAVHVSVDNFMNAPEYDEVVARLQEGASGTGAADTADAEPVAATAAAGTAASATPSATGATASAASANPAAVSAEPAAAPAEPAAAEATSETPVASSGRHEAEPETSANADAVLVPESVTITPTATNRDDAIREVGAELIRRGAVTEDYIDAMFAREADVSTFMGNFLAIPHGTNEAKQAVLGSALAISRFSEPIDWNGNPVHFVVGIAGKDGGHLTILSKIAQLFADEANVDRLLAAATSEELYQLLSEVND